MQRAASSAGRKACLSRHAARSGVPDV